MSSYQLSERVNAQSLLWDSCGLILAIVRKTAAIVGRFFAIVSHLLLFLAAIEPYVMGAFVIAGYGLLMFAGVSALVSMIPATFWLGLVITGALAYVGYPRTAVRK